MDEKIVDSDNDDDDFSDSGSENSEFEKIPKIKVTDIDENENEFETEFDSDVDLDDIENEDDFEKEYEENDNDEMEVDEQDKPNMIDFSDDESDEEDDKNHLQKFDEATQRNVIADHHPELIVQNHHEVETLCHVIRNEDGIIIDQLHKTLPFVTKYERAKILGERAKQINAGATPFVEVNQEIIDGYLIALAEFEQKKIPMIIRRPLPNNHFEYWRLEDLENLF